LHREITGFDMGCLPRRKFVKNRNYDIFLNSHINLKRLRNHFSQPLKYIICETVVSQRGVSEYSNLLEKCAF
jgi:hypothetical protein